MRSPQFGRWHTDDDPADRRRLPFGPLPGWDLRDEPPEEEPVMIYRLTPEEIAAKYGPPAKRTEVSVLEPMSKPETGGVELPAAPEEPEKWPISPERLRELFLEQGLDRSQIARRYGVTTSAVASALGRYNIRRNAGRPPAAGQKSPQQGQATEPERILAISLSRRLAVGDACQLLQRVANVLQGSSGLVKAVQIEIKVEASGGEA